MNHEPESINMNEDYATGFHKRVEDANRDYSSYSYTVLRTFLALATWFHAIFAFFIAMFFFLILFSTITGISFDFLGKLNNKPNVLTWLCLTQIPVSMLLAYLLTLGGKEFWMRKFKKGFIYCGICYGILMANGLIFKFIMESVIGIKIDR